MTDTEKSGGDPQVKFTKDLDEYDEKCFTLKEKTERVYANVKRDSTMLEIGTGSSIVIEDYDRFAIGYDFPDEETAMKQTGNWHDRAVFSYWKSKEKKSLTSRTAMVLRSRVWEHHKVGQIKSWANANAHGAISRSGCNVV